MIDQIFADIMKEARSRKGKDLRKNLYSVLMDIGQRLMASMDAIREEERREERDKQDRKGDNHRGQE